MVGAAPPPSKLVELARDWLDAKNVSAPSGDTGNSDRARNADLCRIGRALRTVTGRPVDETSEAGFNLDVELGDVALTDLSSETMLRALACLRSTEPTTRRQSREGNTRKATYKSTTVERTLATTRGFCRWLVRHGHLSEDPFDDDTIKVRGAGTHDDSRSVKVLAFSEADVSAMIDAAGEPLASVRSAWPRRDVATIELLAGCGVRASELLGLEVRDVDTDDGRVLLRVSRGVKGGKPRQVPIPGRAHEAIDDYLTERRTRAVQTQALAANPSSVLFVRNNGRPFDSSVLDRLIRRVAAQSGVGMPGDAAAHAFRHYYGISLTLRGVPPFAIQQLMGHRDPRTTSIYTEMASDLLAAALDDAGWL